MTIEFRHVDKRTRKTISPVSLKDMNFSISEGERTALLGHRGAGLEVILDLICGADAPDSGDVIRDAAMSWPIPGTSFMHKHLSFEANANFIARLYGVNPRSFREKVMEMAGVQELRLERMDHCPKAALSRFAFALGVSLPFDLYILTNTNVGDKDDRGRFKSIINEIIQRRGILLAGSNGKAAQELCEKGLVIDAGQVVYHDDIEEAVEHFGKIKVKPSQASEPEFMDETEAEEELEQDDF